MEFTAATAESATSTQVESSPRKKPRLIVNVSETQYAVVRWVARKVFNWRLSTEPEDSDFDVWWCDSAVQPERLSRLQPYQKINHFPGMYALARKNHLARNLSKMKRSFAEDYDFFPQTWVLPAEFGDLKTFASKNAKATFIVKPEASCQGKGIFLTRNVDELSEARFVVQKYVEKPLLIDNLKFDLRIYVLVAGCDPLRIFLHEEGLARLATEEYVAPSSGNLGETCMHLTNYAVNKTNPNFVFNEDEAEDDIGHKRSLTSTLKLLKEMGYDVAKLKSDIADIVIKTLCSVQPSLAHIYKTCQPEDRANACCFEILGFDILLNEHLKPWLLEVNHSPSFTTDTPLDKKIKRQVIAEALTLLDIHPKHRRRYLARKRTEIEQRTLGKGTKETRERREALCAKARCLRDKWEAAHLGGFTKIFPCENSRYAEFLKTSMQIWQEWTGVPSEEVLQAKIAQKVAKSEVFVDATTKHTHSKSTSREEAIPSVFERLSQTKVIEKLPAKTLPSIYPEDKSPSSVQTVRELGTLPAHLLARLCRDRQASVQPQEKKSFTIESLLRERRLKVIPDFSGEGKSSELQIRLRDLSPRSLISPLSPHEPLFYSWRRPRLVKRI